MEPPIQFTVRQILDYYGKCPRCGYPAGAAQTLRSFADDRVEVTVVATCELPCGWHGPVTPTTMTAGSAVS
ncbi:hypothetical protein OG874_14640 [Nocardia sp. NBC_00565]|uniref:hypothetical protein n=1 Tax=Nocardia sp. NBC_00565 TaxID=2975993 RepID=UPI002E80256D|nr:hypothetical protein [Nocardia sp. NBC_00565]WUC06291.1 hypothetical protein OG874_14640 [Nocardia sp. NBC_00565]